MKPDRYASVLNAVIESAKQKGLAAPGSDHALACYQLIEVAISEAEVWGVPLDDIGLDGFDAGALLQQKQKHAA